MTIVVNAFHTSAIPNLPWVMVHATDRLVSLQHPDRFEPKYPLFNKTVIYRPSDAIVAIGFTGIAAVEGMPTDEWIVSTLAGRPLSDPLGMSFGQNYDVLNLGQATTRLAERLSLALVRGPDEEPLSLVVSGAHRERHRWRRVALCIERSSAARFEVRHFRWLTRSQWNNRLIVGPAGWLPPEYVEAQADQLGGCCTVAAMQHVVDDIVAHAAKLHPTAIGRDITRVTLFPFASPVMDIVYLHRSDPPSSEGFTPFMLGRRTLVAPSAVTGPISVQLGGVRIDWRPVGLSDTPTGQEPPVTPGYVFSFRPHPDREHL